MWARDEASHRRTVTKPPKTICISELPAAMSRTDLTSPVPEWASALPAAARKPPNTACFEDILFLCPLPAGTTGVLAPGPAIASSGEANGGSLPGMMLMRGERGRGRRRAGVPLG